MIVRGEPWMIPALSQIWETSFGDSPEYIRFFMEHRFSSVVCFVWLEHGKPVGTVYLLPSLLQGKRSFYSYAGGVLPGYRGKGIFKELFRVLMEFCKEENATLTGVPDPRLINYYRKMGYESAFSYRQIIFSPKGEEKSVVFRDAGAEEYVYLRDKAFHDLNYVQWDVAAVKYALEENHYCGGFAQIVTFDQDYLLFGKRNKDTLNVMETTLSPQLAEQIVPNLCGHWDVKQVSFRFPAEPGEKRVENGGIWGTAPFQDGWIGLELL